MKKKALLLILLSALMLLLGACGSDQTEEQSTEATVPETEEQSTDTKAQETDMEMKLLIDDQEVSVDWENNEAVSALTAQVQEQPLTIDMAMYEDFEQVGELGVSLPTEDTQIETESGDIMLYAGDKIVVFYGQNSWAYTRLGKIKDKNQEEMTELLGQHDITITLK